MDMQTPALASTAKKIRNRKQYIAPRNAVEQALVEIWQELLGMEQIGVLDNFFELGGHSLLVISEISAIRDRLNVEVPVKEMFVYGTVSELAERVTLLDKITNEPNSVAATRPEKLPLSFSQERLWFIDQLEGSVAYHLTGAFRLKGTMQYNALQYALQEIINRHEILRTVFREEDGQVWQHILDKNQWKLQLVQHNGLHTEEEIGPYMQELISQPFDLANDHPFRCHILPLAANEHLLILTLHHIASDGWSRFIIVRELVELYNAYIQNRPYNLPALPMQYADYALWQRQWLTELNLQNKLTYWKNKLAGVSPLNLPTDFTRPAVQDNKGRVLSFHINKELAEQLYELCRQQNVTLYMLLLTALKVLLYRYSGQEDICVGSPVAGRTRREQEELIGFFVNVLPLRSTVRGNSSFESLLQQVKQTTVEGYEHQDVPFEKIVQSVTQERDMSRNPLFQVMFILQNTPSIPALRLAETILKEEPVPHTVSMFDFSISITENSDGLQGYIEYATSLFAEHSISRMIGHYGQLLKSIVAKPIAEIGRLPLITHTELEEIVNRFNDTTAFFPADRGIADLFEEQAMFTPGAVAIVQGNESITYRQLNERSNQLAFYLQQQGIRDQRFVAVCVERSIELVTALLAVSKAGAVYIPIDPGYPEARIGYMLNSANPAAVITGAAGKNKLPGYNGLLVNIDDFNYTSFPTENIQRNNTPGGLLAIIFTSGSTGKPKGVKIAQQSVLNRLHWMWKTYPYASGEKSVCKTAIGFVDHICEIFSPLLQGIPSIIIDKETLVDIDKLVTVLAEEKITRLLLVPSLLRAILLQLETNDVQLPALKYWICSGEALPPELLKQFYEIFPSSNHTLLNIYGSTEVTADVTCFNTIRQTNSLQQQTEADLFNFSWKNEVGQLINDFSNRNEIIEPQHEWNFPELHDGSTMDAQDYLRFLQYELLPGIVNVSAPAFIGHMTGPIPPFVNELSGLMTMLNQNLVKIETSLAASFLERQVITGIHQLVYKQDDRFYNRQLHDANSSLGVITNGGTLSNITALSYALNKKLCAHGGFGGIVKEGLAKAFSHYAINGVAVIGSPAAHYSVYKALQILGLGKENFISFHFDKSDVANSRIQLEDTIEALQQKGILVLAIVGVAGATETGQVDPLLALAAVANKYGIHYHVDAAFGGAFLFSSRLASKLDGIEYADTVTICAHKQLLLPVGASLCLFNSNNFASYSENNTNYQARKNSFDLGRFTIEGSRPFSALLLHCVLKVIGPAQLGKLAESNFSKTILFAGLIRRHPGFELVGEPELNILNYRYIPESCRDALHEGTLSEADETLIDGINIKLQQIQFAAGKSFVSYTRIHHPVNRSQVVVLRVVMMNPATTAVMLENILDEQVNIADTISNGQQHSVGLPSASMAVAPKPVVGKLIGKPIANTHIYIMDEHLQLLPIGVPGEICVSGIAVSQGFLHPDQQGAERFIYHSVMGKREERFFRTGDIGRWLPDGNIEYLGRKDDQLKIRGQRIEPSEIEQALQQSGLVKQSVVTLYTDKAGNPQLVAYVVTHDFDPDSILTYLRKQLPSYMVPSILVPLTELPLNPNGKIDKQQLPAPVLGNALARSYKAPRTVTEEKLCGIWQELLGTTCVGINDNFFSLGGHSMLAFRVTSEIKKTFGASLPVKLVFTHATIATLAICVEAVMGPGAGEYEEIEL